MQDFSTRVGDRFAALTDGEGCFYIGKIDWTFMSECHRLLAITREYRHPESALSEAA